MTDVPIDPSEWGRGPYAIVATPDMICFLRNPGAAGDPELRARVNAPEDALVLRHGGPEWDTDLITWTCHVCGRERLDQFISVAQRPVAMLRDGMPDLTYNVRYCNDCETCTQVATTAPQWPPPVGSAPYQGCVQR